MRVKHYIVRTEEGPPRPNCISKKRGPNTNLFTQWGLEHHLHRIWNLVKKSWRAHRNTTYKLQKQNNIRIFQYDVSKILRIILKYIILRIMLKYKILRIILKYIILHRMFSSYCIEIKQVVIHAWENAFKQSAWDSGSL